MLVTGVGLFVFREDNQAQYNQNAIFGTFLIAVSLLMDGLTGAVQDRMRSVSKPSAMHFMFFLNGWSSTILITYMAVTGEGRDLIEFARRHPTIIWQLGLVVLVGTLGQIFLTEMITNFGSLPTSLVTTTRKFFTVLVSVLAFGNDLSPRQWISTGIIFSALFLDALINRKSETGAEVENEIVAEAENHDKFVLKDEVFAYTNTHFVS